MSDRGITRPRRFAVRPFPRTTSGSTSVLLRTLMAPLLFLCLVLGTWEASVRVLDVPAYVLPTPTLALSILAARFEPIAAMAATTLGSTLVGFVGGVSIGLTLGILIGSSRRLYETLYPPLVAFNAIPAIALIPLFIVWFGVGPHISVLTAIVICFFPVTVVVATAVAASSPDLDDVLRSLGASRLDIMRKVALPRALPSFFSSIKIAITGAFIGTIVAETVASNSGIGYLMIVATNNMDVPLAFAGLFVLAVLGIALYGLSLAIEKRLTAWSTRQSD